MQFFLGQEDNSNPPKEKPVSMCTEWRKAHRNMVFLVNRFSFGGRLLSSLPIIFVTPNAYLQWIQDTKYNNTGPARQNATQ